MAEVRSAQCGASGLGARSCGRAHTRSYGQLGPATTDSHAARSGLEVLVAGWVGTARLTVLYALGKKL